MGLGWGGWFHNRLRRTLKAFLPGLARPDDAFAQALLTPEEWALYRALDPRDREHAVRVARRLERLYPGVPEYVLRAALLHDAGKALRPYRPLERILTGLYAPSLPPFPLRPGLLGAFQVRRHHPLYAAARIRDPRVRALVLEHHAPKTLWGQRLHEADRME